MGHPADSHLGISALVDISSMADAEDEHYEPVVFQEA
jgi:hypothetical protein